MNTRTEEILSIDVVGTTSDIAAAAAAIVAEGGTIVSVQATPTGDGITFSGRIDYLAG